MFAELFAIVQPTDPKVAIGLSFLARGKGSPLYDPAALLATLDALSSSSSSSEPAALKAHTTAELQAMLDSAPSGIPAPVTKAALVVSTDVSLRSTDGTADTDDRIALILLCYVLARLATAENVHSVTIALCARKKGSNDKKDTTTPADVVQFMRERIAFFSCTGTEASDGLEPPTPSFASFGARGVEVRVFQLQAQTTPSPEEKLDAAGLVAQHKQIAELREANAAVFAVLEAARHEAPIYFTGCGPIGVDLALFLAEHAHAAYTISFGSGVNGGDDQKSKEQVTHCGGLVLFWYWLIKPTNSACAAIVDIGPSTTRALVTPPGIVLLDDAKGAAASASNTFKVAGSPMIVSANGASADSQRATGLGLRIFVSNCFSFLGRETYDALVAQCTDTRSDRRDSGLRDSGLRDLSIDDEDREGMTAIADFKDLLAVQFPYSHSLALTMVTGLLAAHGTRASKAQGIDHTTDPASDLLVPPYFAALSELAMPPSLAATVASNINGITTVAGLYKLIALGMDARLGAIMAEWTSISSSSSSSGLEGLSAIPAPVVSTAAPIITPAGLTLAQPF
jgi:hypothetical protein